MAKVSIQELRRAVSTLEKAKANKGFPEMFMSPDNAREFFAHALNLPKYDTEVTRCMNQNCYLIERTPNGTNY